MQIKTSGQKPTHEKTIEDNGVFYFTSLLDGCIYYILDGGIEYKVIFKNGLFNCVPLTKNQWVYDKKGRKKFQVLDYQKRTLTDKDIINLLELKKGL